MQTLIAQTRESKAKLNVLRASDRVPAVVYGTGMASTPLSVDKKDFIKLFKELGETSIFELVVGDNKYPVLIHDLQVNATDHRVLHVDFLKVDMKKPIEVSIPLEFVGEAPAEKMGLGVLVRALQEIEIEVLPTEIPQTFTIDVSSLDTLEANIYVRDIKLPKSATLITDGDVVVATCAEQREDEGDSTDINFDEIAVEKKGKKEEDKDAE